MSTLSNLTIAQAATLREISFIAKSSGLTEEEFEPLGRTKGKLTWEGIKRLQASPQGKLILVTAITPTPHGEGKTTITVGLSQGLSKIGRTSIPATREPALGPIFGTKGGACGGGYSQVLPMEEINLFFNGDFPAISAAHNLLSAMLDAHLQHGNALGFDVRRPMWPRTVDMNDRALRQIMVGMGGTANGVPREDGFVITPASEIMAVLCLADSLSDLKKRVGRIIIGMKRDQTPITANDLGATGAMTVLLKDALRPNLVQTIEGGPALVHGGPFANIAHGCSSILGTRCALGLADFCVTEAGFASDLGAEKFMHIAAPAIGRHPDCIVLVATVRALKHQGEGDLMVGMENLRRHIRHLKNYGPPVVVAINLFAADLPEELEQVKEAALKEGADACEIADAWMSGGEGCMALAKAVEVHSARTSTFCPLYGPEVTLEEKLTAVVQKAHGGQGVSFSEEAKKKISWLEKQGMAHLPVCVAKTQNSLSDNPDLLNAPTGFDLNVREIRVSAGAGFIVCLCGEMMLMPGLSKKPAALQIDLDDEGRITGLF